MHIEGAQRDASRIFERPKADWVVHVCGLAWNGHGPGVAVAQIDRQGRGPRVHGRGSRTLVRRAEAAASLELELEAAIAGLEAACLDAALNVTPQDDWRLEIRTASERFLEMIATCALWTRPGRAQRHRGFAALRHKFDCMAGLILDIQDMGGKVMISRIGRSKIAPGDARVASRARLELNRHLARRADAIVRPMLSACQAKPRGARFFEVGVRAGLRAALAAPAGAGFYRRGRTRGGALAAARRAR
jgi:hypothetical protein